MTMATDKEFYAFETISEGDKLCVSVLFSGEQAKELLEEHCYRKKANIHCFYNEGEATRRHSEYVALCYYTPEDRTLQDIIDEKITT